MVMSGGWGSLDRRNTNAADMEPLREPKGQFQETVRTLAEAAMSALHHDVDESEPAYRNEMRMLERKFTNILRGKLKP